MRPIIKGAAPRQYTQWRQARNDLGTQIGWYCSYCEMSVTNMLEVEHIIPINHGGPPLAWNNFLLACRYCNAVKDNNNTTTVGYVWPDRDNTDLAYIYSPLQIIQPVNNAVHAQSTSTINLMGLDRKPGGPNFPTAADSRWIFRIQAWLIAQRSLRNWNAAPSQQMADQIALTAFGTGFYSIWMTVFINDQIVLNAIRLQFPNTYFLHNAAGHRVIRPTGII
jgi:hypothetical protein